MPKGVFPVEPVSPREWGRQQAAASPPWSEEKWQRVAAILGIRWLPVEQPTDEPDDLPEAA